MEAIKINELISAVKGTLINNLNNIDDNEIIITNLSTDSRNIGAGDLFIPLVGDKYDGHDFISSFEKGASFCLSQRRILKYQKEKA